MQPLIPFDSLPEQEQLEVLRYIEATNSEDIEQAIRVLRSHNMKAQVPIPLFRMRFDRIIRMKGLHLVSTPPNKSKNLQIMPLF